VLSSDELSALWRQHAAALRLIARGRCGTIIDGAADDCVQEAFVRLAAAEPPPREPASWLLTAVRNAAIDALRSQRSRVRREQAVAADRPQWLEPVDTASLDQPSADDVQIALQQLDDTTRDIVIAHLWNDMTFREIADAINLSAATAHRRYEAGIGQLRKLMSTAATTNES